MYDAGVFLSFCQFSRALAKSLTTSGGCGIPLEERMPARHVRSIFRNGVFVIGTKSAAPFSLLVVALNDPQLLSFSALGRALSVAKHATVVLDSRRNRRLSHHHQDLDRYPRQLERDVELLAAEGLADLVFAPGPEEMYSPDHR